MAAVNPQGSEDYWFEGLPAEHLVKQDEGTEDYWFNGLPGESLVPEVITEVIVHLRLLLGVGR